VTDLSIQPERIDDLNGLPMISGSYVLYWMQQSQRAEWNHALEFAVEQANRLGQPLLVAFGLIPDYPEANLRHYAFMLEGLKETQAALHERGIKMLVRLGNPPDVASGLGEDASLIVCDRGYLGHQKQWRQKVAKSAQCKVIQVESDVVVPVDAASSKTEYAARTIRPKINRLLPDYLALVESIRPIQSSLDMDVDGIDLSDSKEVVKRLEVAREVGSVSELFKGGTSEAKRRFQDFLNTSLESYDANSNQPQTDDISHISMYLHFGQVSPLWLADEVVNCKTAPQSAKDAFLEQLIVRRELAMNFVNFTPNYDTFDCLPDWARKTLAKHSRDPREAIYDVERLDAAQTHDTYWNAAMTEMKVTGFMHNYMRMYWGKKILEWSETPRQAFDTALHLNNKYFLDGRDANSFTGVAWLFGMHDRPWKERPIFGMVRYMSASGLKRKCDIAGYVEKVKRLAAGVPPAGKTGEKAKRAKGE